MLKYILFIETGLLLLTWPQMSMIQTSGHTVSTIGAGTFHLRKNNKFVMFVLMNSDIFTIEYYSERVQAEIGALPVTIAARYIVLMRRMQVVGPNLGEPHTKSFGGGLFEMRLKGAEGIGRVFYCTRIGRRIVMLHSFVKKADKTPLQERRIAEQRLKEIQNDDAR